MLALLSRFGYAVTNLVDSPVIEV